MRFGFSEKIPGIFLKGMLTEISQEILGKTPERFYRKFSKESLKQLLKKSLENFVKKSINGYLNEFFEFFFSEQSLEEFMISVKFMEEFQM